MGFRIMTTGGYEMVTDLEEARMRVRYYRESGIYEGLKFVPNYVKK